MREGKSPKGVWVSKATVTDTALERAKKLKRLLEAAKAEREKGEKRPEQWTKFVVSAQELGAHPSDIRAMAYEAMKNGGTDNMQVMNEVGSALRRIGDVKVAEVGLKRSLDLAEAEKNALGIYHANNSLGTLYFDKATDADGRLIDAQALETAKGHYKAANAAAMAAKEETAYPCVGLCRCALVERNMPEAERQIANALANAPRNEYALALAGQIRKAKAKGPHSFPVLGRKAR